MQDSKLEEIFEKVYFKILNFISYNLRSEKEVADRLTKYLSKYRISSSEKNNLSAKLTSKLEEGGYLNDLNFAFTYIKSVSDSKKPVSKRKITHFLMKKGISRDMLSDALDSLPADFSLNNAVKDAEKKLRLLGNIDEFSKKRKLYDYLFRKGYDSGTISSVVDTLL
ncbi:RecX family transcriptional regulator [Patescibacteria group bacterium]|nr:RecX family transcriptional regulator [Patescibacteria group bacterium]MBU1953124.1 RecX family transcriptional regulator [Patescibacteria group bacterium]